MKRLRQHRIAIKELVNDPRLHPTPKAKLVAFDMLFDAETEEERQCAMAVMLSLVYDNRRPKPVASDEATAYGTVNGNIEKQAESQAKQMLTFFQSFTGDQDAASES